MIEAMQLAFGFITLVGALGTAFSSSPFDKLISLGVLAAGVIPFIVDRGYLDVAVALALIVPIGTIFILLVCRERCHER